MKVASPKYRPGDIVGYKTTSRGYSIKKDTLIIGLIQYCQVKIEDGVFHGYTYSFSGLGQGEIPEDQILNIPETANIIFEV